MTMLQVEVTAADASGTRLADKFSCSRCGERLIGPRMSSYLGLGRIAHFWQCDRCGYHFETTARLAGSIDAGTGEVDPANGKRAA